MGLRTTMKAKQNAGGKGLTGPTDIDNGMQTYFRNHGAPSATSQNATLATYDEYRKRLQEQYLYYKVTGINPTLATIR